MWFYFRLSLLRPRSDKIKERVSMATIGHIHIKVRDLEAATDFYTRFLGLQVVERVGNSHVFLTAGEMHHHLALQYVGPNALLPERHTVGLHHTVFEVADKQAFAKTYRQLTQAGIPVAATDHRVSWALYLTDPSLNGVEIYCDTRGDPDGASYLARYGSSPHRSANVR